MGDPLRLKFVERFPALKRLALSLRDRRIPIVRQLTATDCGAAALAMVLEYYGKRVPIGELREALGGGRDGATAAALLRVGRAYGLRGRGVHVELEALSDLPCGAILFWEFSHFLVYEHADRDAVEVADPAFGRRAIPMDRFRRGFSRVALLFEPTEEFEPGGAKPKRIRGLVKDLLAQGDLLGRIISVSLLIQVLSLAMPLITGMLVDRVAAHKDYSLLVLLGLGYCSFQVFNVIAGFVRAHLLIYLRTRLEAHFTLRFLDHLVELPYAFFQQRTTGDLMIRLGSNNAVREMLTSTTLSAFLDGALVSLYLVLLLVASLHLTMLVIILGAARLVLLVIVRRKQRELLAESVEIQSRSQSYQVEMLSGMEALKGMGLEHRAAENWSNFFVDGLNISIRQGRLEATFNALLTTLSTVTTLVLMFYGVFLVLEGTFTLGTLLAFNALAAGFLGPLNNLVSAALQMQLMEVYLERINDVMETPAEQSAATVMRAGMLAGAVTLDSVSFRYAPQSQLVIRDVSIDVQPGTRVALVGRTGSGKSTLARLMTGLYEPGAGRIMFDGKDFVTLDRPSVRSQLGIVTQETQLFAGSIRGNIAFTDPQMSLDRVIHAAKLACIHDEIMAMPMAYETLLSDRGLSLSGGQRQRLALARALAAHPKILVLDEATSHLDAVTESIVNRNLASLHCTRIVIAHRLSTTRDADHIVVLEGGTVIEQGVHDQLLAAGGVYATLVASQQSCGVPTAARA